MKVVAALQPGYLPWLGYFDLMKRSDLFVIEDNLKYTKQDWRNRNRIRAVNGATYLTVPVKKGASSLPINEVEIDNEQPWARRHWNLIEENYRCAPFWPGYAPVLRDLLERPWFRLIDLDLALTEFLAREFRIETPTVLLSELPVVFGEDKTESLVALIRAVNGTAFVEGASGRNFIDVTQFEAAGLGIRFQDYVCRPYPQQYEPFISHLSALDLLLNVGPEGTDLV